MFMAGILLGLSSDSSLSVTVWSYLKSAVATKVTIRKQHGLRDWMAALKEDWAMLLPVRFPWPFASRQLNHGDWCVIRFVFRYVCLQRVDYKKVVKIILGVPALFSRCSTCDCGRFSYLWPNPNAWASTNQKSHSSFSLSRKNKLAHLAMYHQALLLIAGVHSWDISGDCYLNSNPAAYRDRIRNGSIIHFGIVMIVNLAIRFVTPHSVPTYLWPAKWATPIESELHDFRLEIGAMLVALMIITGASDITVPSRVIVPKRNYCKHSHQYSSLSGSANPTIPINSSLHLWIHFQSKNVNKINNLIKIPSYKNHYSKLSVVITDISNRHRAFLWFNTHRTKAV